MKSALIQVLAMMAMILPWQESKMIRAAAAAENSFSDCIPPAEGGIPLIPDEIRCRLVLGNASLEEVFLLAEVNCLAHPRKWVFRPVHRF